MSRGLGWCMGCLWVARGGLLHVPLYDMRPECEKGFHLCPQACFSSSMPRWCLSAMWSCATGVQPVTRGSILFSVFKQIPLIEAFSYTICSLRQWDVKGHLLRVSSEHFLHSWKGKHTQTLGCTKRPYLEKLLVTTGVWGSCLQIGWNRGQVERAPVPMISLNV